MRYRILVTETTKKVFECEAGDEEEALQAWKLGLAEEDDSQLDHKTTTEVEEVS